MVSGIDGRTVNEDGIGGGGIGSELDERGGHVVAVGAGDVDIGIAEGGQAHGGVIKELDGELVLRLGDIECRADELRGGGGGIVLEIGGVVLV